MSNAYRDRRGAVFGLTVAEIFILLAFVLMLLFLALSRQWETYDEQGELQALSEAFQSLQRQHGIEQPSEVVTLVKSEMKKRSELEETIKEKQSEITSLRKVVKDVKSPDGRPVAETIEDLTQELAAANKEVERLITLQEKGVNPPCWYSQVPAGEGKLREKPYYTFLIAVFDDGLEVLREPTPGGWAEGDEQGGTYASEAESLNLQDLPYNTRLSNREFVSAFRRVHDAGKSMDVRSYSCVLFVKVWDKTSQNAKAVWKETYHDSIERLFGTYLVADDPWPGAP